MKHHKPKVKLQGKLGNTKLWYVEGFLFRAKDRSQAIKRAPKVIAWAKKTGRF